MKRSSSSLTIRVIVVAVAVVTLPMYGQAEAQVDPRPTMLTTSYAGVGFTMNAPNQFLGASLMIPITRRIGVYADAKMTHDTPADDPYFVADVTPSQAEFQFGDQLFRERDTWRNVNGAVLLTVAPQLALYAGGGAARRAVYREYVDQTGERGRGGYYWIEDGDGSDTRVNLLGGALMQAGRNLFFQFGGETAPAGITAGVMFALPIR